MNNVLKVGVTLSEDEDGERFAELKWAEGYLDMRWYSTMFLETFPIAEKFYEVSGKLGFAEYYIETIKELYKEGDFFVYGIRVLSLVEEGEDNE